MIDLNYVRGFFPPLISSNSLFEKQMLKEYLQLMVLNYLSTSEYAQKLVFIGGTNLRLIHRIDRFSEDLDFDCKQMTRELFTQMTDSVVVFLKRHGLAVETRDKENPGLTAFRRSFYFPQLLFDLSLSAYKEERFLIKIETQDQGISYSPVTVHVNGCGFFFPIQVPEKSVLCAMKIAALLGRHKGRDFYDCMFLLSLTAPDYNFLGKRCGINTKKELQEAVYTMLNTVDLNTRKRDFEHLLFNRQSSEKVLHFREFIQNLS